MIKFISVFLFSLIIGIAQAQVPNAGSMVPNTIPGVQSNLNAAVAPTISNDSTQGYSIGSIWQNSATGQVWVARSVAVGAAVWNNLELSDFPSYIVGNFYIADGVYTLTVGNAATANLAVFSPLFIKTRATFNALGFRINTLAAAGNVQAAIYANNPVTGRPTGSAIVSTANISTTAAGNVNAVISAQFEAGLYWWGSNSDNSTVVLESLVNSSAPSIIGSTTANNLQSGSAFTGVTTPLTFGTWGDLTGATWTNINAPVPVLQFKIGSVP